MDNKRITTKLITGLEMFQKVSDVSDKVMIEILNVCIEIYKQKIKNIETTNTKNNSK